MLVGPLAPNELSVPPHERGRGHDERRPALPRQHPAPRREEQPVPPTQLGALDLPAKHGELVAQDEHLGFGIRGYPARPESMGRRTVGLRPQENRRNLGSIIALRTSDREMIPTSLPLSVTGTRMMLFSSRTFMISSSGVPTSTEVTSLVMISCASVVSKAFPTRVTARVRSRSVTTPTTVPSLFATGTPLNSPMRSWIATSLAVAVGVAATTGRRMMSEAFMAILLLNRDAHLYSQGVGSARAVRLAVSRSGDLTPRLSGSPDRSTPPPAARPRDLFGRLHPVENPWRNGSCLVRVGCPRGQESRGRGPSEPLVLLRRPWWGAVRRSKLPDGRQQRIGLGMAPEPDEPSGLVPSVAAFERNDRVSGLEVEAEQVLCGGSRHDRVAVEAHVQDDDGVLARKRTRAGPGAQARIVGLGRTGAEESLEALSLERGGEPLAFDGIGLHDQDVPRVTLHGRQHPRPRHRRRRSKVPLPRGRMSLGTSRRSTHPDRMFVRYYLDLPV